MCEHHHEHDNEEQETFPLIRIGFSILVCVLAVVTHPVGWFGFGMFLVAYIIAGGDIILQAFKNILKVGVNRKWHTKQKNLVTMQNEERSQKLRTP